MKAKYKHNKLSDKYAKELILLSHDQSTTGRRPPHDVYTAPYSRLLWSSLFSPSTSCRPAIGFPFFFPLQLPLIFAAHFLTGSVTHAIVPLPILQEKKLSHPKYNSLHDNKHIVTINLFTTITCTVSVIHLRLYFYTLVFYPIYNTVKASSSTLLTRRINNE